MKRGVQNFRHLRSLRPCRGTVSGVSDRCRKGRRGYHPGKKADTARLWATISNVGEKFGFLRLSVLKFWDIFARNARVERQAGERIGAVNGPRLDTLRPEIPTARGFFEFGNGHHYGAVMKPLAPIYGAQTPVLLGKIRCHHRRHARKYERNEIL